MRSIFLLRWGTGGPLDGRDALARPGSRMRAAFGLPEPPASVIAALARGSPNLLRPELSCPPRPRGRSRAMQATSWTRHPTAKDSEATCGKVWPRKRPREPREDRHPKGRDLRAASDHAPASIRWLGTRRRAAHLGGRDGRCGKLGEWAGAAGARVEPAPGRACPRATARGHERSGFAMPGKQSIKPLLSKGH